MVVRVVHVGDGSLILFILLPIVDYLDSAPYLMHKGGGGCQHTVPGRKVIKL